MPTAETKKIITFGDFNEAVLDAHGRFHYREPWWRGQAKDWELLPGIWRHEFFSGEYEQEMTIRFLLKARPRHAQWPEGDHSVQLAMMRHYGLPTRLLDWTESPLFALFFVVQEREHKGNDGVLWALSPAHLNIAEAGTDKVLSSYKNKEVEELFRAPFDVAKKDSKRCLAVAIREATERMTVQLSQFTIHGSGNPLDKKEGNSKYLVKYIVPKEAKDDLREMLNAYGIRESNLFPDLEHLANEIKDMVQDGKMLPNI